MKFFRIEKPVKVGNLTLAPTHYKLEQKKMEPPENSVIADFDTQAESFNASDTGSDSKTKTVEKDHSDHTTQQYTVGSKVCHYNDRVVGEIVELEGLSAKVSFNGDYPKIVLLSKLILASDLQTTQPTNKEEDWTDYEDTDPVDRVKPSQPSKQPVPSLFDYEALKDETRVRVQECTNEIKTLVRNTQENIITIGKKLAEVQQLLRHDKKGGFRNWLSTEFGWTYRSAYNFIHVWETFGNCENFSQLNIATSALYLLAAPSTPEAARKDALKLAQEGVPISNKLAKNLVAEYKPQKKPKQSPFSKEALQENQEKFSEIYPFQIGDRVELLNPPPESGWSPGDRVIIDDVDYQTQTVFVKLDPNQIGRLCKSFSFEDVQKVDTAKSLQAKLFSLESIAPTSTPVDFAAFKDEDLKAAFKAIKQNLKAVKLELTRRYLEQVEPTQLGKMQPSDASASNYFKQESSDSTPASSNHPQRFNPNRLGLAAMVEA